MANGETAGFFGRGNSLVTGGFPLYIEEKYNETLSQAAWFAYDGMWRAASSGIVKGMLFAAASVLLLSAGVGGLTIGATVGAGVYAGLSQGLATLTTASYALPILAMGGAVGAVHDIAQRQTKVQRELAKAVSELRDTQKMVREYEINATRTRAPGEGIEVPVNYDNPDKGQNYWQNKVAPKNPDQGMTP